MASKAPPAGRRFFTLDEANRMLPLIRRIVEDIAATARLYERKQTRLHQKGKNAPGESDRRILQAELYDHGDRLEDCLQELRSLGVEFKGWDGLVDFPAWEQGREIEYCWKQGEAEIGYWHEIYTGFSHRKPLPVTEAVTPEVTLGDPAPEEFVPDDLGKPAAKPKSKAGKKALRRGDDLFS
jgi:hypothetical protein